MSGLMVLVVLSAALMHAGWSILVKLNGHATLNTTAFMAGSAFLALLGLPFVDFPTMASMPFMLVSIAIQITYMALVGIIYQRGDISQSYPIMRGMPPLFIALVSGPLIGESLTWRGWIGILLISFGVCVLALEALRRAGRIDAAVLPLTFVNAVLVACYTVLDGIGIRISGSPSGYILWIFFLIGAPRVAYALLQQERRTVFVTYITRYWWLGILGGMLSLGAYGLALWAMTFLPVAVVAALRETSILFAIILSFVVLREKIGLARMIAAVFIVCGVIAVRLA
ncbi:EamA family transporter [Bartonella sp. LJL80]